MTPIFQSKRNTAFKVKVKDITVISLNFMYREHCSNPNLFYD